MLTQYQHYWTEIKTIKEYNTYDSKQNYVTWWVQLVLQGVWWFHTP